jgi:hypothetical protein
MKFRQTLSNLQVISARSIIAVISRPRAVFSSNGFTIQKAVTAYFRPEIPFPPVEYRQAFLIISVTNKGQLKLCRNFCA